MSREDLERAVIEAAVEWFAVGRTEKAYDDLVVATARLISAPLLIAYEDRDGDVWHESREVPGHWCLRARCMGSLDGIHGQTLDYVRAKYGPLKEVPDDRV